MEENRPIIFQTRLNWAFNNPGYSTSIMQNGQVQNPNNKYQIEAILYKETKDKYDGLQPKEVLPPLSMTVKEAEEYSHLSLTINDYVKENIVRFATGNRDIDKKWDNYFKELKDMGLDRYLQITQTAYDR